MTSRLRALVLCTAMFALSIEATSGFAYPRPGRTERFSVTSDGIQGNSGSDQPSISADGRFIAFDSFSTNLVPGDTNGKTDVFVHDRETGTTERVSLASAGDQGNDVSESPALSADGRFVAFYSRASNLVPGDTNGASDVFLHDRNTGATERVSVATDGSQTNSGAGEPAITSDGRYVAFNSSASNLVPGDTNNGVDVFVRDRASGTTERVSVSSTGGQHNGHAVSPSISGDGRYVAFYSGASNLVPGDSNQCGLVACADVFVRDRQNQTTEKVSVATDGTQGDHHSVTATISSDGRFVTFYSGASNLVAGDTNEVPDLFLHDRQNGTLERISVASSGAQGDGSSDSTGISADGRLVVFDSDSTNLASSDTNAHVDVFLHDRLAGTTERLSVASDGTEGNSLSFSPAISADGSSVVFRSFASTLVAADTNGTADIFLRDRGPVTGVSSAVVKKEPGVISVSGSATFSGARIGSVQDPSDDGGDVGPLSAKDLGAEIIGASVAYRTEEEDLLLRIPLASLPDGGRPGVLYRWTLTARETNYELRSLREGATAAPPAIPYFGLYICETACIEKARLSGGIGSVGDEVRVVVPLQALGIQEAAMITDIRASTAIGEASPGPLLPIDEVALADAVVPISKVDVGIAPISTLEEEVSYTSRAELIEGSFSGSLDVSHLSPGEYALWMRACLGTECGTRSVMVSVP